MLRLICSLILVVLTLLTTNAQVREVMGISRIASNPGYIYKIDQDSLMAEKEYVFELIPGQDPSDCAILESSDGMLYGSTNRGGEFDNGIIYQYNPNTNELLKLHSLKDSTTGRWVKGLVEIGKDTLYGITQFGGMHNLGLLFRYHLSKNSFEVIQEFDSSYYSRPSSNLLQVKNKIYWHSGLLGYSSLFSIDLKTDLITQEINSDSIGFVGGMTTFRDSLIVGYLGTMNDNSVFIYNSITNDLQEKRKFSSTTARNPTGEPTIVNDKLYGVTYRGGQYNIGTIFEYDATLDSISVLHSFKGTGLNRYGLVAVNDVLYGRTPNGGIDGHGVLYEFDLKNSQYTIRSISPILNTLGANAIGRPTLLKNGNIVGLYTSHDGGIYFFNPKTLVRELLVQFNYPKEIYSLRGKLLGAFNHKTYGVGQDPHKFEDVFYEYDPVLKKYKTLFSFNDYRMLNPLGELVESDEKIYGVTSSGGQGRYRGSIYSYDIKRDSVEILHNFNLNWGLEAGLIKGKDGKFYGTTSKGGKSGNFGDGTIYSYDPINKKYKVLYVFPFDGSFGKNPECLLAEDSVGIFWGFSDKGVFRFNSHTSVMENIHDFRNSTGEDPYKSLVIQNDNVYGLNRDGGPSFGKGTFFKINTNTLNYTNIHVFGNQDSLFGQPSEELLELDNGKIITPIAASTNHGTVLFVYDTSINKVSKQLIPEIDDLNLSQRSLSIIEYCNTAKFDLLFDSISLCNADTLSINLINKELYDAEYWYIFKDSSGFIDSSKVGVFNFVPETTGYYYVSSGGGCARRHNLDSLFIQINASYSIFDSVSVCAGGDYKMPDDSTILNIQSDLDYTSYFIANNGCDSLIHTFLEVISPNIIQDSVNVCKGDSYKMPDGSIFQNIDSSFSYLNKLKTFNNCDSLVNTFVHVFQLDNRIEVLDSIFVSVDSIASYQWLDCNADYAPLIGDTLQQFKPLKSGSYAVQLRYLHCIDTSHCEISSIGLNEFIDNSGWNIYPNPNSGVLWIDGLGYRGKLLIKVLDLKGRIINESSIYYTSRVQINTTGFEKGIYVIEIQDKFRTSLIKVIMH